MPQARMHDGATIDLEVRGNGPAVLLPLNPKAEELTAEQVEDLRSHSMEPNPGHQFVEALKDSFTVVAFDYEVHVVENPKPATLTGANITKDFLAVADAAGIDRFAVYGYGWLAVGVLQVALRTSRVAALIMGGFSPIDGPYEAKRQACEAMVRASESQSGLVVKSGDGDWNPPMLHPDVNRQFLTMYEDLRDFDDRAAQSPLSAPRLVFVGSLDEMTWGDVTLSIADPVIKNRAELEKLGWDVRVLEGLTHLQARQPSNVLPVIRPWLLRQFA